MCPDLASVSAPCEPACQAAMLRRFLQAYWLRPENALWMTLRSTTLARCALRRPSIDLSCGDGVFSFLHCSGVFDPAFDVFQSVDGLDRVQDQHADMFDCADERYHPAIQARPGEIIDVGTDMKPALLAKAQRLDLYGRLVEHDNNHLLPFDADSFQTVYCNAAYWVVEIESFLREIARITRPGGWAVLQVKLTAVHHYTLEAHRAILGERWLEMIDRGRRDSWPTVVDRPTWEDRFEAAGLKIEQATPFVTRTHAHLWDIGLRPIAPMLVKMTQALTPQTRSVIKRDWVDLFCELLEPFCDPAVDLFDSKSEPAEIQYVLTPK